MHKLRPTMWRTCRAIASETRIRLLWELFRKKGRGVTELAHQVGISEPNASIQLRTLNSRGLILPVRKNVRIIYQPEANSELEHAEQLLNALHKSYESGMPIDTVIHQATAFTHVRRILIVRALQASPLSFGDLQKKLSISTASLALHLNKLEARHYIKKKGTYYRLAQPGNVLGQTLIEIACR